MKMDGVKIKFKRKMLHANKLNNLDETDKFQNTKPSKTES